MSSTHPTCDGSVEIRVFLSLSCYSDPDSQSGAMVTVEAAGCGEAKPSLAVI